MSEKKKSLITAPLVQYAARRWFLLAAPLGLILGVLGAGLVFVTFEPQFEARYRLQINQDYIVFPRERQPSGDFIGTQAELIRSPLVLDPVLADPDIVRVPEIVEADDPIAHLAEKVGVRAVGGAQLFDVTYSARNPIDAAKVVNRIVESYFHLMEVQDGNRTKHVTDLLDHEKTYWAEEVKQLRDRVRSLSIAATGKDPEHAEETTTIGRDPLSEIQIQLANLGAEEAELKVRIKALEQPAENTRVPLAGIEDAVERSDPVRQLKATLLDLQWKEREFSAAARSGRLNDLRQDLRRRISDTQAQLAQTREDLRTQMREELETALNYKRADELDQLKTRLEGVQAQAQHLQDQFSAQFAEKIATAKRAKGDTVELEFARVELEQAKKIHDLIATRIIHIRTEDPLSPVLRLIPAKPPALPVEALPYRKLALAFLGGLGLPFLLAVAVEVHLRRVTDSQQLLEANVPVVGEIAMFPTRVFSRRHKTRRFIRGERIFAESIDSLRTYLVLSRPLEELQVLAVTSATSGEGKTSIASKLAVSIAQATHSPTLLIDGDTRQPDIHKLFDISLEPGLVEVLAGDVDLDDALYTEYGADLHILPAGILHTSPHRLFGNGALSSLLQKARGRYRYIVIDTPPVLPASESLLLASAADVSLICVMRDRSRMDMVNRAYERLQGAGANLVGAVMTGVPTDHYAQIYGDYSYERSSE